MPPTPQKLDSVFFHSPGLEIQYSEKPPYSETYTRDGAEVRRTLQCNWVDAISFPIAVLGDVRPGEGGGLKRLLPHSHPHGAKNLYAVECNLVNGAGAWTKDEVAGLIQFSDRINNLDGLAEWEVVYRQLTYDVRPDADRPAVGAPEIYRYVTRKLTFAMENYQLPGCAMQWSGARQATPRLDVLLGQQAANRVFNVPIPESAVKRRPIITCEYTWHWVPEPLPRVLTARDGLGGEDKVVIGRVNSSAFDPDVLGFRKDDNNRNVAIRVGGIFPGGLDPGHVMCDSVVLSDRLWTPAGTPVRDITWSCIYRPDAPWTSFWRQSEGRFERVDPIQEDGDPLYKPGNFDLLFAYS